MISQKKWTSSDLDSFPYDELTRYEIIDGELFVSSLGYVSHQAVCGELMIALAKWNDVSGIGSTVMSPGLVLSESDDVVPDVIWIHNYRLRDGLDKNGHLRVAPEIIAEVLMPRDEDRRRDREVKLLLYSRCGVIEYWVIDWTLRCIDVYSRGQTQLHYVSTLFEGDHLKSSLLKGFSCSVASLFHGA